MLALRSAHLLKLAALLVTAAAATLVSGCGDASGTGSGDPQTVVLREWAVTKSLLEAPAGNLRFRVRNNGSIEHELVIVKTELPVSSLPIDEAQSIVDLGATGEVVGEVKSIPAGDEKSQSFSLTAGKYALICNISGHYQQGMYTEFMIQ